MSVYQTDDEQVEALKKWWKENGVSVVSGIVLGFAVIGGWQGWQKYQTVQGEAASAYFANMQVSAAAGDVPAALTNGKELLAEYPGSAYAVLSALNMAKLAYQSGQKDVARQHLQWAVDNADAPALANLARVRLVRLLLDTGDLDAAEKLLSSAGDTAHAAQFAELEGDLAQLRGAKDAARAAYERALEQDVHNADLLRMKITDLAGGGSTP